MKKSTQKQNTSRKDAETQSFAKQTNDFHFAGLCAFAPWREVVHFFTSSDWRAASDQPKMTKVKVPREPRPPVRKFYKVLQIFS